MIKIIHLSDFHLNKDNLYDWNTYIKSELITTIKSQMVKGNKCFIVCTGDLIDRGGKSYSSIDIAFETFKKEVVEPILDATGLSIDHFILTPGNHDINRDSDFDFVDTGLKSKFHDEGVKYLNTYTKNLIETENKQGAERIKAYCEFVKRTYKECVNVTNSYLGTTFVFEEDGCKIGFSCINTAWCCYDDNDNKNGVYIGEPQYNKCLDCIKDCDIKIAIMHHPIDWLKLEKDSIGKWIYQHYNIFLCGHVHEAETTLQSRLYNMLFVNVAPCFTNEIRQSSNSFANGFSIIDYIPESKQIGVCYFKYKFDERKYILNTDYVSEGKLSFTFFDRSTDNVETLTNHARNYIKEKYYPFFDSMLIPQKANVIQSLQDAFVMPPIIKHASDKQKLTSLSDLIYNGSNVLILGAYESGKSVLLYRLVIEANENLPQYGKLPIYIDFNEIGNRDIESIIKEFTDLQSHAVKTLLKNNRILLLIDNYNPTEEGKYISNRIYTFLKENNVTCIATYASDMYDIIPQTLTNSYNEIAFEYYHMHPFHTENIKDLMGKWLPNQDSIRRNEKITKMVNNFCSYSLPCTAMSVSLYLWSTENEEKEPVNQAVLLDIYIEIILERLSDTNIYHNSFDYDNKIMLLSYVAYRMREDMVNFCKSNNETVLDYTYTITYAQYISFISDYLKLLGWEERFDAEKLGTEFINLKIFRKTLNAIKFSHSCFYYFFLAKRMIKFDEFKNEIIQDNNYYKNDRTIDYYAGLSRSDESLLSFLIEKLQNFFEPVQQIYEEINVDECFTNIIEGKQTYVPKVESANIKNVVLEKPSKEHIEKKLIKVCDEKLSKITDDFSRNQVLSPDKLIVMLGKALRNLDSVENKSLKQSAYNLLVKNTIIFAVIMKEYLASYANSHSGELPPALNNITNVEAFFRYMPFALQWNLNEIMGTSKLSTIFEQKLAYDYRNNSSDVEKYFSMAMLWDNTGTQNVKEMKKIIKEVKRNSVLDYLYFKIRHHYNYRVAIGSSDEDIYLELLLRLTRKRKIFSYLTDSQIKKQIQEAKNYRNRGISDC